MLPYISLNIEQIARICHETNRAYCQSIGDDSQPSWQDAPQWQRDSAMQGVRFKLENPASTPASQHSNWMLVKWAEGWVYGPFKDVAKKEHPCLVPYEQLSVEQRLKDSLFCAVVHAFVEAEALAVAGKI